MQLVAGVAPVDNVTGGFAWLLRVALGQQMGAFVLIADKSGRGGVPLGKGEMSDDPEASVTVPE